MTGWVVKPVEIDDVPVVTLALTSATDDSHTLRRVGEEVVQRLSSLPNVSRAYVVGGEPRTVRVDLDPERLQAYGVSPLEVQQAVQGANIVLPAGSFTRNDAVFRVKAGMVLDRPEQLAELVVGVFQDRPVFLKDIANVRDGPAEVASYVRHGWGPARDFEAEPGIDRHVDRAQSFSPFPRPSGPGAFAAGRHDRHCQAERDQCGELSPNRAQSGRGVAAARLCPAMSRWSSPAIPV